MTYQGILIMLLYSTQFFKKLSAFSIGSETMYDATLASVPWPAPAYSVSSFFF